jgi:hypothetical protein
VRVFRYGVLRECRMQRDVSVSGTVRPAWTTGEAMGADVEPRLLRDVHGFILRLADKTGS